jgi:glyoxylase-like metal-dependent hydrolase (beta-lactamase superfamily II)
MIDFQTFIGGILETNAYLLAAPEGAILFDAPTGTCEWLEGIARRPDLLLITHGHIDHIEDAHKVKVRFGCKVGYHPDSVPLITEPDFFKQFGFFLEVAPTKPDFLIDETSSRDFLGLQFEIFLVPGHCPGSLCFYLPKEKILIGGDVLFAGSIGRTDLPSGDHQALISNIKNKLYRLPDETKVLPGHGPSTTIGHEKRHNPFVRGSPPDREIER